MKEKPFRNKYSQSINPIQMSLWVKDNLFWETVKTLETENWVERWSRTWISDIILVCVCGFGRKPRSSDSYSRTEQKEQTGSQPGSQSATCRPSAGSDHTLTPDPRTWGEPFPPFLSLTPHLLPKLTGSHWQNFKLYQARRLETLVTATTQQLGSIPPQPSLADVFCPTLRCRPCPCYSPPPVSPHGHIKTDLPQTQLASGLLLCSQA